MALVKVNGKIRPAKRMATSYARSPSKNMTMGQLDRLAQDNFHNPDTGLELDAHEAQARRMELAQKRADKKLTTFIKSGGALKAKDQTNDLAGLGSPLALAKSLGTPSTRSRGRRWVYNPIFRTIHGHAVPFERNHDEVPF
jgi:hypothetical protein